MICVRDLCAEAGSFHLRGVSFEVSEGEYFALLGPSGAGKSLLLETILGLHPPSMGSIHIAARDVTGLPPEERGVAYLPQDLALFPHLSVRDNLLFGARARKLAPEWCSARLEELCQVLDIAPLLERPSPDSLSIGEQQRVALARALLADPCILFLDEPFSALDGYLRRQLQMALKGVNRRFGLTVLHVTHSREEAFLLGDRLAVLLDGRIEQLGTREELYYRPGTLGVAQLLLNQNILSGEVQAANGDVLEVRCGRVVLRAPNHRGLRRGDAVWVGIRPEEVAVIREDRPLGEQVRDNLFTGTVASALDKGGSHLVFLEVEGLPAPLEIDLPTCGYHERSIRPGRRLRVSLKRNAIWALPLEADGTPTPAARPRPQTRARPTG
ncbi:MAG: ABC transporter ATP-binding protein [Armatimonadota bacterium]